MFFCVLFMFWVLTSLSTHCLDHITTGGFMGRRNQCIQLVKVLHCKLQTNGKQLSDFILEVVLGTELRSQRWEARVLPLHYRGPYNYSISSRSNNQPQCFFLCVFMHLHDTGSTYMSCIAHFLSKKFTKKGQKALY